MKTKINIHGVVSLLLFLDATTVAFIAILNKSMVMAGVYLLLFIAFLMIVSIVYCSKCSCRQNCNHLIIGWISQKLSKRKYGKYTNNEIIFGVFLPLIPTLVIPQFYLYHNTLYLILYWVLSIVAALEISFYVCRGCKNTKCLMCKQKIGAVNL